MPPADALSRPEDGIASLLVVTCDKYADLWPILASALSRFWPDRSLPGYWIVNESDTQVPTGFAAVRVGPDKGWSANLLGALSELQSPYVLLWLDDLIPISQVDNLLVDAAVRSAFRNRWSQVALAGKKRQRPDGEISFSAIARGDLYRASTVLTLWRTEVLMELLDPRENAWQFEYYGSARSDRFPYFMRLHGGISTVVNLVVKGLVDPTAWTSIPECCRREYAGDRPRMNTQQRISWLMRRFRSTVFQFAIPAPMRRTIRLALLPDHGRQ